MIRKYIEANKTHSLSCYACNHNAILIACWVDAYGEVCEAVGEGYGSPQEEEIPPPLLYCSWCMETRSIDEITILVDEPIERVV